MNQSNWKQQIAAKMSAGGTLTYDELEAALAFAMQERATFRAMLAAAPARAQNALGTVGELTDEQIIEVAIRTVTKPPTENTAPAVIAFGRAILAAATAGV